MDVQGFGKYYLPILKILKVVDCIQKMCGITASEATNRVIIALLILLTRSFIILAHLNLVLLGFCKSILCRFPSSMLCLSK